MVLNIIVLVCMLIYLGIQSFFDIYNQCRVPAFPGYIIIGITFANYIVKCIQTNILYGIKLWIFLGLFLLDVVIYLYCKKKNLYVKGITAEKTLVSQQLLNYAPYALLLMITVAIIDIPMGLAFGVIWFLSAARFYGNGDRNAFWAMLFFYATFGTERPQINLLLLLLMYFIASVTFMIRHKAWTLKNEIKRFAFFPYIMAGFIITVIIGGLSYGRF